MAKKHEIDGKFDPICSATVFEKAYDEVAGKHGATSDHP